MAYYRSRNAWVRNALRIARETDYEFSQLKAALDYHYRVSLVDMSPELASLFVQLCYDDVADEFLNE